MTPMSNSNARKRLDESNARLEGRSICNCAPDCADRIACEEVGDLGHFACGWCDVHEQANHICMCLNRPTPTDDREAQVEALARALVEARLQHFGYNAEWIKAHEDPPDHAVFGCELVAGYGWQCDDEDAVSRHPDHDTYAAEAENVMFVLESPLLAARDAERDRAVGEKALRDAADEFEPDLAAATRWAADTSFSFAEAMSRKVAWESAIKRLRARADLIAGDGAR